MLNWHERSLCFHHKWQEAQLSHCHQGTKVKPFDYGVITQQVYLPMLHHYSAFTCTAHCQEKGPLLRERSKLLIATLVSPTEWITELRTVTCSYILLLSQTADRLAQWVWWPIANLASLILWDELCHELLSETMIHHFSSKNAQHLLGWGSEMCEFAFHYHIL